MKARHKHIIKKAGQLIFWAALSITTLVLFINSRARLGQTTCSNVSIHITGNEEVQFIDDTDVQEAVMEVNNHTLTGSVYRDVNFSGIENALENNPYVSEAEVVTNRKGGVDIRVWQKQPILRVINSTGVDFYLTLSGEILPVSSKFTARVPVATGDIPITSENAAQDSSILNQLWQLARLIEGSTEWKAMIEQIDVDEHGAFTLIPKFHHVLKIGEGKDLKQKLKKLEIFYKEISKQADINEYKTISVQYNGQIVCAR